MQRNNGDMIILSSTYVSFESSATVEPRQRISNINIYLYVSDQSVFNGSEAKVSLCKCADSPDPSLLEQNGIQSPFESPHENFEL